MRKKYERKKKKGKDNEKKQKVRKSNRNRERGRERRERGRGRWMVRGREGGGRWMERKRDRGREEGEIVERECERRNQLHTLLMLVPNLWISPGCEMGSLVSNTSCIILQQNKENRNKFSNLRSSDNKSLQMCQTIRNALILSVV